MNLRERLKRLEAAVTRQQTADERIVKTIDYAAVEAELLAIVEWHVARHPPAMQDSVRREEIQKLCVDLGDPTFLSAASDETQPGQGRKELQP